MMGMMGLLVLSFEEYLCECRDHDLKRATTDDTNLSVIFSCNNSSF